MQHINQMSTQVIAPQMEPKPKAIKTTKSKETKSKETKPKAIKTTKPKEPKTKKSPTPECPICVGKMPQRSTQSCCFCDFTCCKECWITHMDTTKTTECMSCHVHYTISRMSTLAPPIQKKTLSILLEAIFVKEEEKFAATHIVIEKITEKNALETEKEVLEKNLSLTRSGIWGYQQKASEIREKIYKIVNQKNASPTYINQMIQLKKNMDAFTKEADKVRSVVKEKQATIDLFTHNIDVLQSQIEADDCDNIQTTKKCPHTECAGYLLTKFKDNDKKIPETWVVCSNCKTRVCVKCDATIKGGSGDQEGGSTITHHECLDADLESKRHIELNSRPCPQCKAPISKIVGCNHMWCVLCKVGFDYSTMKIIPNTKNTNPHLNAYRKELQKKGLAYNVRESEDFICGGTNDNTSIVLRNLSTFIKGIFNQTELQTNSHIIDVTLRNQLSSFYYLLHTIREAISICVLLQPELSKIREQVKKMTDIHRKERIEFCRGNLSKEKFLSKLKTNLIKTDGTEGLWTLKELLYELLVSEVSHIYNTYSYLSNKQPKGQTFTTRMAAAQKILSDIEQSAHQIILAIDFYNTYIQQHKLSTKAYNLGYILWYKNDTDNRVFTLDNIYQRILKHYTSTCTTPEQITQATAIITKDRNSFTTPMFISLYKQMQNPLLHKHNIDLYTETSNFKKYGYTTMNNK